MHFHSCNKFAVEAQHDGMRELHVSYEYKHLGTWTHETGRMSQAIAEGFCKARAAMRPIQHIVLCNPQFALKSRVNLASSLVLSKPSFNSHVWPQLNKGETKNFITGVNDIYRKIAGRITTSNNVNHYDNEGVSVHLQVALPQELLTCARLRFWRRLLLWAARNNGTA